MRGVQIPIASSLKVLVILKNQGRAYPSHRLSRSVSAFLEKTNCGGEACPTQGEPGDLREKEILQGPFDG
jgi:hypothetical protein